ncbi:MAG: cation-transporting P-type ATPase, partial [Ancalomicrobiaceae bacterium]|nr:cation-transporting P-type ATPase [Ancalomicrobiaceae bacterium]
MNATDHHSDTPKPATRDTPGAALHDPQTDDFGTGPLDDRLARLTTTPAGLTMAEARARLATYGRNDAASEKRTPLWLTFLARFRNPLIVILLGA